MPPPRQYVVYASKHDVVVKMRKTAGRHTAQQQSTAAFPTRVPAPLFGGSEVLRAAERAFGTPSSTASGGIGVPGITGSTELQPRSQQSSSPLSVQGRGALGALSSPLAFGVGTETSFRATTPFSYSLGDGFTIGVAPPVLRCKRHRRGAKARWTRAHSRNAARPTGAAALARRAAGRAFGAKAFGRHESDSNNFASVWHEGGGGFAVRNETYAFTSSAIRDQALPANLKRAPVVPATKMPSAPLVLGGAAPNGSVPSAPGVQGGGSIFGSKSTGGGGFQIGTAPAHMKGRRILRARRAFGKK